MLAASDAIIIGFNVRPAGNARQLADKEEIDIRYYLLSTQQSMT
jgi:translation initiation factor IF-2